MIWADPTRSESPEVRSPAVVLFHGIARTSRSLRKLERALQQASFATLNLEYPSRGMPLDLLAEHIHPAIVDLAGRNKGSDPISRPFDGRTAGASLYCQYRPAQLGRVVMLGTPKRLIAG